MTVQAQRMYHVRDDSIETSTSENTKTNKPYCFGWLQNESEQDSGHRKDIFKYCVKNNLYKLLPLAWKCIWEVGTTFSNILLIIATCRQLREKLAIFQSNHMSFSTDSYSLMKHKYIAMRLIPIDNQLSGWTLAKVTQNDQNRNIQMQKI